MHIWALICYHIISCINIAAEQVDCIPQEPAVNVHVDDIQESDVIVLVDDIQCKLMHACYIKNIYNYARNDACSMYVNLILYIFAANRSCWGKPLTKSQQSRVCMHVACLLNSNCCYR